MRISKCCNKVGYYLNTAQHDWTDVDGAVEDHLPGVGGGETGGEGLDLLLGRPARLTRLAVGDVLPLDGRQDQEQVEQGAVEGGHFVKLTMLSYFQMYTSPGQYGRKFRATQQQMLSAGERGNNQNFKFAEVLTLTKLCTCCISTANNYLFFISTGQLYLAIPWCLYLCRLRFCLFVFALGFVECVCGHICSEREIELVINGSSSGGGRDHFGPQYLNPNLQEQIVKRWGKGH